MYQINIHELKRPITIVSEMLYKRLICEKYDRSVLIQIRLCNIVLIVDEFISSIMSTAEVIRNSDKDKYNTYYRQVESLVYEYAISHFLLYEIFTILGYMDDEEDDEGHNESVIYSNHDMSSISITHFVNDLCNVFVNDRFEDDIFLDEIYEFQADIAEMANRSDITDVLRSQAGLGIVNFTEIMDLLIIGQIKNGDDIIFKTILLMYNKKNGLTKYEIKGC